jgi:hypothetical protein
VLGAVACSSDTFTGGDDAGSPDGSAADAGADADGGGGVADGSVVDAPVSLKCDWSKPFGAPAVLQGFGTSALEGCPRLSHDELTMYFHGYGGALNDGSVNFDLYQATRPSKSAGFGTPARLAVSTGATEAQPSVSNDGLTLFFEKTFSPGVGHLWSATRASTSVEFGAAAGLAIPPASLVVTDPDGRPFVTGDGAELWFSSIRIGGLGGFDLYAAPKNGSTFGTPVLQSSLSSPDTDQFATLSADRLTVYLASDRPGALGGTDIWVAHRTSTGDAFLTPVLVPELNSTASDSPGWLSADNCRLYMESNRGGTSDLYLAERKP